LAPSFWATPHGGSTADKNARKVAKTNHNKPTADRQAQHEGSQEGALGG